MIRLRDFAKANKISDRTVQVHIKKNQELLNSHIERRGKQGTWLDEFAVDFLLDQIQLPTKAEVYQPSQRELQLMLQLSDANARLADAERRAGENATAAGKLMLLEEQSESLRQANLDLQKKVLELELDHERSGELKEELERLRKENQAMKDATLMERIRGWRK